MAPRISKVVIIGAGIGGPAITIALHQRDISCAIYEMRPANYHIGGSMVLTPNALRVLDQLGVYEKIRAKGFEHEGVAFYNPNYPKGGVFGTLILGSKERYGYPALRLYRDMLRQALLDEAHRRGVMFHWNMRCISVENETSQSATVIFENGEKVIADLVIGVDGINSRVRQYIAPHASPQFTGQLCIIGFAKKATLENQQGLEEPRMYLGKAVAFGVMPAIATHEDILFFSTMQSKDRTREEWQALDADKEGLKAMLQRMVPGYEWPPIVHELVTSTPKDTYFIWPFNVVPDIEHFISSLSRVVLAGDAAHALPPTVGQSGAITLEDAATLAITLEHINHSTSIDINGALLRWERHRKERIAEIAERTKSGANIRKVDVDYKQQAEKEEMFKKDETEDGLSWLYEYNGTKIDAIFRN